MYSNNNNCSSNSNKHNNSFSSGSNSSSNLCSGSSCCRKSNNFDCISITWSRSRKSISISICSKTNSSSSSVVLSLWGPAVSYVTLCLRWGPGLRSNRYRQVKVWIPVKPGHSGGRWVCGGVGGNLWSAGGQVCEECGTSVCSDLCVRAREGVVAPPDEFIQAVSTVCIPLGKTHTRSHGHTLSLFLCLWWQEVATQTKPHSQSACFSVKLQTVTKCHPLSDQCDSVLRAFHWSTFISQLQLIKFLFLRTC